MRTSCTGLPTKNLKKIRDNSHDRASNATVLVAAPFLRRFLLCPPPSKVFESLTACCPVCSSTPNLFLFPPARSGVSSSPDTLFHISRFFSFLACASPCFACFFLTLSGFGPFGPFLFLRGGSTLLSGRTRAKSEAVGWRACCSVYGDCVHWHK